MSRQAAAEPFSGWGRHMLSGLRVPQSDEAIEKWLGSRDAASSHAPWATDVMKALVIVLLLEKSRAVIDVADAIFAIRTGAVVVPLPGDAVEVRSP